MFILKNNELCVEIIDPKKDRKLLGSRYCTGGYIYQVKDVKKGNLFSGPQFPNPNFDVFHGQGAPEVFVIALNQERCNIGEDVFVLGVGAVTKTSPIAPFHVRDNPVVKEFCIWEINEKKDSIEMTSKCVFNRWKFIINKRVTLNDRKIVSQTNISNNSELDIPIRWFAHPFFPFPPDYRVCKFFFKIEFNENDGYFINNEGFIEMKSEYNWKKGLYQKIFFDKKEKLSVIHKHPLLGEITAHCDFIPESIAIWANDVTFSFEPFYNAIIESGGNKNWSISYCF
jgi:hypothetical protein